MHIAGFILLGLGVLLCLASAWGVLFSKVASVGGCVFLALMAFISILASLCILQ